MEGIATYGDGCYSFEKRGILLQTKQWQ